MRLHVLQYQRGIELKAKQEKSQHTLDEHTVMSFNPTDRLVVFLKTFYDNVFSP